MDATRFDILARAVAVAPKTRRGILRVSLGSVAAIAATAAVADGASACRKNGRQCDPDKTKQCCSGRCKKTKNGGGRCRPFRSAKGCTIKDDTCQSSEVEVECPGNAEGFCVVLDNGKPFCGETGICFDCDSDRDCTRFGNGTPGKCITKCRACADQDTNQRACVFAQSLPDEMIQAAAQRPARFPAN